MTQQQGNKEKEQRKEAMRTLREARKQQIAAASAKLKEHNKAVRAIKEVLAAHAATVPSIAEQTGMPSVKVLWYIATLRTYGQVLEGEKEGSYFLYILNEESKGENIGR